MLPQAVNTIKKRESQLLQIHGLNLSDNISPGDMVDSSNISAHRFPYISTRLPREKSEEYVNVTGLSAHSELVVIEGTDVYYGGEKVEGLALTEGDKQIVAINTKICIYPDNVYLQLGSDGKVSDFYGLHYDGMEDVSGTLEEVDSHFMSYGDRSATLNGNFRIRTLWYSSDASEEIPDETLAYAKTLKKQLESIPAAYRKLTYDSKPTNGTYTSYTVTGANVGIEVSVTSSHIYIDLIDRSRSYTDASTQDVKDVNIKNTSFYPKSMDYVCAHNNRIYGCSNTEQAIYASALGDPTNFYQFSGLSTDAYTVNIASPGDFTGCCAYSSSVLFFKEAYMHKLLGDYPAEYYLYQYEIEGVKEGAYKSMAVINESLYYMGIHGVYRYNGSTPQLISANFGNTDFQDAIAGTDGDTYYLSVKLGNTPYLLAYETRYGLWILEDHIRAIGFARLGRELYFADTDGNLWHMNSGTESNMEWSVTFAPMYEWVTSSNSTGKDGHKVYSRICLNVELAKGSYIVVSVSCDGKPYESTGAIVGSVEGWREIRIPINRCNKFQLKLSGKGKMAILSILREYATRSSV